MLAFQGNLSGGNLSKGELVRGEFVQNGTCPQGHLSGGNLSASPIYISILWSNNNCSNNFLRWFTNYQPSDDHCSLLLRISAIIPSMVKFDQDLGAQTSFLFSSKVASSSRPALLLDS